MKKKKKQQHFWCVYACLVTDGRWCAFTHITDELISTRIPIDVCECLCRSILFVFHAWQISVFRYWRRPTGSI